MYSVSYWKESGGGGPVGLSDTELSPSAASNIASSLYWCQGIGCLISDFFFITNITAPIIPPTIIILRIKSNQESAQITINEKSY